MTKVVGFIAGPGVGKSTIATGLFSELKQRRVSCEYVNEFAKEITFEETHKLLENQIYIFSEQFRRQFRLLNKVDFIITDCPLFLNSIYFRYYLQNRTKPVFSDEFTKLAMTFFDAAYNEFDNKLYYIQRRKPYDPNGRNQNEDQAKLIDQDVLTRLRATDTPFSTLTGMTEAENIQTVLKELL